MKTDHSTRSAWSGRVKLTVLTLVVLLVLLLGRSGLIPNRSAPNRSAPSRSTSKSPSIAKTSASETANAKTPLRAAAEKPASIVLTGEPKPSSANDSTQRARNLLWRVLDAVVNGPAFDAKVRETVWVAGRTVVGVGTYEQAGLGSGQYNLQLTMHDGDGKHHLQQVSDGRLAWTRTEIGDDVQLRRVTVGRLEQWSASLAEGGAGISPKLIVGGWGEMLHRVQTDYHLRLEVAELEGRSFPVIVGSLKSGRRQALMEQSGRKDWPELFPTRVHIAVNTQPEPETGFGVFLPTRFEFWSDPIGSAEEGSTTESNRRRMISLIELYSLRQIAAPPPERFRFDSRDPDAPHIDETDRYAESYGAKLTERDRVRLRR